MRRRGGRDQRRRGRGEDSDALEKAKRDIDFLLSTLIAGEGLLGRFAVRTSASTGASRSRSLAPAVGFTCSARRSASSPAFVKRALAAYKHDKDLARFGDSARALSNWISQNTLFDPPGSGKLRFVKGAIAGLAATAETRFREALARPATSSST